MAVREQETQDKDLYYCVNRTYNYGTPAEPGGHLPDSVQSRGFGRPLEASGDGSEEFENGLKEPQSAQRSSMLADAPQTNGSNGGDEATHSQRDSYTQCANGHYYNAQAHAGCPFCPSAMPGSFDLGVTEPVATTPVGGGTAQIQAKPPVPVAPPIRQAPLPQPPASQLPARAAAIPPRRGITAMVIAGLLLLAGGAIWVWRAELPGIAMRMGAPFHKPPVPPRIDRFSADPEAIDPGQSTKLAVAVRNAEKLTIEPGVGALKSQDPVVVNPHTTTAYTLTATGPGGVDRRMLVVSVKEIRAVTPVTPKAPSIEMFSADSKIIRAGEATTLRWRVSESTDVQIEPDPGAVSGDHVQVRPLKTTAYTLVAKGPGGSKMETLTIAVEPAAKAGPGRRGGTPPDATKRNPEPVAPKPPPTPRIMSFTADRQAIDAGAEVVLSYSVENAASVTIDPGAGTFAPMSQVNQVKVHPSKTTTYTLTAHGSTGEDVATIQVTVNNPPPPAPPPPQPLSGVFHCPNGSVQAGQTINIDNLPARLLDLDIDQTTWWVKPFQTLPNGQRRLPLVARKAVNGCEITWKTKN
jgi:hypothetical protein